MSALPMKIAAIQVASRPGNVQENLDQIRHWTRTATAAGCRLVLFPESADLGYDFAAIRRHGPDSWPVVREALAALARECGICLVCGVCVAQDNALFNSLVAWGPDGMLARYDKTHLFRTSEADESRVFTPGHQLCHFDWEDHRFGLAICYDLRFPELFRALTLRGCQTLLLASAWPHSRIHAWQTLCQARAMENQCFVLGANRAGLAGAFSCGGRSLFVGPDGSTALASPDHDEMLIGHADVLAMDAIRDTMSCLAHRRPEIYADL